MTEPSIMHTGLMTIAAVSVLLNLCALGVVRAEENIAAYLQAISVTLKSNVGEGSGVVVKRGDHNYVLTAGHVVAALRKTREIVDREGRKRTVIEFDDAGVMKRIYEGSRKVGQLEMLAEVICYSDAEHGEDLAVLRILKRGFIQESASFYLKDDPAPVGQDLYHCGSLRGELGSNSVTTGVISQVGRIYRKKLYDQTSVTAFPGSSGGGVFLRRDGQYVGMLTRGAGETFNLMIPMRRIRTWMDKMGLSFVLDPSLPVPDESALGKIPIEDTGAEFKSGEPTTRPGDKIHDWLYRYPR